VKEEERLENFDGSWQDVHMETSTEPMEPSEQLCPNLACGASGNAIAARSANTPHGI